MPKRHWIPTHPRELEKFEREGEKYEENEEDKPEEALDLTDEEIRALVEVPHPRVRPVDPVHRRAVVAVVEEQDKYSGIDKSGAPSRKCYTGQPSDAIEPEKAKQILRDGEAGGHPLTEAQKGMFGAAAGKAE